MSDEDRVQRVGEGQAGKPHAFYATRKGTPKGVAGNWANHCDDCGEGVNTAIHDVSNAENGAALLRALEDSDAD